MTNTKKFNSKDWQDIKLIFSELIELPDDQIESRMEELCEEKVHLKSMVEDMVEVHFVSTGRTITPKVSAAGTLVSQMQFDSGDLFGKYQITGKIGSGGMGQVYLAQRNDEVTQ